MKKDVLHNIFVYGTLKKGYRNYHHLGTPEPIWSGWTVPGFAMYSLGFCPGVKKEGVEGRVYGEVYTIDDATLRRLDRLEGHPTNWRREVVKLEGFDEPVEGYIYQHSVNPAELIANGVW